MEGLENLLALGLGLGDDLDAIEYPDFSFELIGKVVPKARPVVSNGRGILPEKYRIFQDEAVFELQRQAREQDLIQAISTPIKIEMVFIGNHRKSSDLDNLAGSILDALVKAEIILDDNIKIVQELNVKISPIKSDPTTKINIFLLGEGHSETTRLLDLSNDLLREHKRFMNRIGAINRGLDELSNPST